ncbi:hypothetical protein ACA910_012130 [Epithemia clementina (nom. ined.)]
MMEGPPQQDDQKNIVQLLSSLLQQHAASAAASSKQTNIAPPQDHERSKGNDDADANADDSAEMLLMTLKANYSADTILNMLTPYLFLPDNNNDNNHGDGGHYPPSSSHALSLLIFLVTTDSAFYLEAASRSVRRAVGKIQQQPKQQQRMTVSPALLTTLATQVVASPNGQVSMNASATLVTCSQIMGLSFVQSTLQAIVEYWKSSMTINNKTNSIARVRCASAVVDLIVGLSGAPQTQRQQPEEEGGTGGATVLTMARESGALSLFVQMLQDESDPLIQMSMLDLLERLASTTGKSETSLLSTPSPSVDPPTAFMMHQRLEWLLSPSVVNPLLYMAGSSASPDSDAIMTNDGGDEKEEEESLEPDSLLGGPALRVLAALCQLVATVGAEQRTNDRHHHHEAAISTFAARQDAQRLWTGFYRALHKFDGSLELDRLVLVDAVSSLAMASTDALAMVLSDTNLLQPWLTVTNTTNPKLKAAILHSIAMVLQHSYHSSRFSDQSSVDNSNNSSMVTENDENNNNPAASSELKKQVYGFVGGMNNQGGGGTSVNVHAATSFLVSLVHAPFPEVRLGAYAVLTAFAGHTLTGAQILLQSVDFVTLLFRPAGEQQEERTKEGREAKYALVQAVYNSPAKGLLAESIVQQLDSMLQRGPHYVRAVPQPWQLATEEG